MKKLIVTTLIVSIHASCFSMQNIDNYTETMTNELNTLVTAYKQQLTNDIDDSVGIFIQESIQKGKALSIIEDIVGNMLSGNEQKLDVALNLVTTQEERLKRAIFPAIYANFLKQSLTENQDKVTIGLKKYIEHFSAAMCEPQILLYSTALKGKPEHLKLAKQHIQTTPAIEKDLVAIKNRKDLSEMSKTPIQ